MQSSNQKELKNEELLIRLGLFLVTKVKYTNATFIRKAFVQRTFPQTKIKLK